MRIAILIRLGCTSKPARKKCKSTSQLLHTAQQFFSCLTFYLARVWLFSTCVFFFACVCVSHTLFQRAFVFIYGFSCSFSWQAGGSREFTVLLPTKTAVNTPWNRLRRQSVYLQDSWSDENLFGCFLFGFRVLKLFDSHLSDWSDHCIKHFPQYCSLIHRSQLFLTWLNQFLFLGSIPSLLLTEYKVLRHPFYMPRKTWLMGSHSSHFRHAL